jgi:hypothetical protein
MKTLTEIYQNYKVDADTGSGDKGSTHSYLDIYEGLLTPYRNKKINFLEIGVSRGHSIMMWSEYFTNALIYGVDINLKGFAFEQPHNVRLFEFDSTTEPMSDTSFESNLFDVIIEDGDHSIDAQVKTFLNFRKHMNKGGIYIIEDVNGIDNYKARFERLHDNCQIIDLRRIKGRFDDVLIIYRF